MERQNKTELNLAVIIITTALSMLNTLMFIAWYYSSYSDTDFDKFLIQLCITIILGQFTVQAVGLHIELKVTNYKLINYIRNLYIADKLILLYYIAYFEIQSLFIYKTITDDFKTTYFNQIVILSIITIATGIVRVVIIGAMYALIENDSLGGRTGKLNFKSLTYKSIIYTGYLISKIKLTTRLTLVTIGIYLIIIYKTDYDKIILTIALSLILTTIYMFTPEPKKYDNSLTYREAARIDKIYTEKLDVLTKQK